MQMVPALLSRPGVHTDMVGGKDIVPLPLSVGSWILPLKGIWHINSSKTLLDIPPPILIPFSCSNQELLPSAVDLLDAEPQTFNEPSPINTRYQR